MILQVFEEPGELFWTEMNTKLAKIVAEALDLATQCPAILHAVQADQDRHARMKKAKRLADGQWREARTLALPMMDLGPIQEIDIDSLTLSEGCPRMPAEVCYVFTVIRGYFGSVTANVASERIREASTIHRYLERRRLTMPAERTILDNLNCITNSTRELILKAQMSTVLSEELDDLEMAIIDSTAVHANSAWPTESELLHQLVRGCFRLGLSLEEFGLPNFREWHLPTWIKRLDSLAFQVNFTGGKKGAARKRRKLYQSAYKIAGKAAARLETERDRVREQVETIELMPSMRERLDMVWDRINVSIQSILKVIDYSRRRILDKEKVAVGEKILSLCDPSAAMIVKGQREAILGYKPQIVRSENGLITGLITPEGNAADTSCLVLSVKTHIENTAVTPQRISCDDGYAFGAARDELLRMDGVKQVSFSGGTGKSIIPEEEWFSDDYQFLRAKRSSVESCIFVLKQIFDFDRVGRRGIENVHAELLEKALAHNFWRIALLRQRKKNMPVAKAG
jgi:hypothetical protein